MEEIFNYPIIEKSDWFDSKEIERFKKNIKKEFIIVKSYLTKYKTNCKKKGTTFNIETALTNLVVTILPEIEVCRAERLSKNQSLRHASYRRNKNKGLCDKLNLELLKYRYDTFKIIESYMNYCYIRPSSVDTNEKFKMYYDELLIRKNGK
jgi:hypothetical protein